MPPKKSDFQKALNTILGSAKSRGASSADVKAGDLHRQVGSYPDATNHRMPVCCDVMLENMKTGDVILSQPRKGKGATLKIRYYLGN